MELLLACLARGVLAVLSNPDSHPDDHAFQERDIEPALVVTPGALRDRFQQSNVVEAEELVSEASRVEPGDYEPVSGDAPAYATYTSEPRVHRKLQCIGMAMYWFIDAMCRKALQLTPKTSG